MSIEAIAEKTASEQEMTNQGTSARKSTSKPLRFTVDRKEMLASVGITPKVLRGWEEAGFFLPELGRGTRRFTPKDVARLRFLNHLHTDLGLSKVVIQRLISRFYYPTGTMFEQYRERQERMKQGQEPIPNNPAREFRLLDLKQTRLLSAAEAFQTIVDDTLSGWDERADRQPVIEAWLIKLVCDVFDGRKSMHASNPGMYEAARRELLDRMKVAELAVRADVRDGVLVSFSPACSDDPENWHDPLIDEVIQKREELYPSDNYDEIPF